ncbi:hypothetical protein ACVOMV_00950 [Mesorhizobium atlanticum]
MLRFIFRLLAAAGLRCRSPPSPAGDRHGARCAASSLVMTPLNASWLAVSPDHPRRLRETFVRARASPLVWDGAASSGCSRKPGFAVFAVLAFPALRHRLPA